MRAMRVSICPAARGRSGRTCSLVSVRLHFVSLSPCLLSPGPPHLVSLRPLAVCHVHDRYLYDHGCLSLQGLFDLCRYVLLCACRYVTPEQWRAFFDLALGARTVLALLLTLLLALWMTRLAAVARDRPAWLPVAQRSGSISGGGTHIT